MKKVLISAIALLPVCTVPVLADTVTIQPDGAASKDALVWQDNPTANYGDSDYLSLGVLYERLFSYIEFEDLDSYAGVTLNEASIYLYCYLELDNLNNYNYISRVTEDWSEDSINWNNRPGYDETSTITFSSPSAGIWLHVDVTNIVEEWLDETSPNYGFVLHNEIGYEASAYFRSGEYTGDPALRPYLYLDYDPIVGIESASLGEVKAVYK